MHKCNSGKVAIFVLIIIVVIGAIGWRWWGAKQESPVTGAAAPGISATRSGGAPVSVTTTVVKKQDLPVSVIANGTVVALQSVEIRSQISATVRAIHFKEGATVRQGELLFTMDNRTEEATQKRADAQVLKSRADYANAERNLKRQRELFEQKFISAAGLDAAMNQFELLKAQLAVDTASAEVARVAKSLTEIRAPFAGRTGAINVRIGSLVQPAAASPALVTISQIDPIGVSFSIPERERPFIQKALSSGDVSVTAEIPAPATQKLTGKLSFVESTIDTASGTIPDEGRLWKQAARALAGYVCEHHRAHAYHRRHERCSRTGRSNGPRPEVCLCGICRKQSHHSASGRITDSKRTRSNQRGCTWNAHRARRRTKCASERHRRRRRSQRREER
ncbi:MAG: efflux RND transporter periplasmic adaptor subunit [Betaproteobacteria bacterium]